MGAHYLATGFGWNLIRDIQHNFNMLLCSMLHAGAIVAIVAGVVGYFVVLRSLSLPVMRFPISDLPGRPERWRSASIPFTGCSFYNRGSRWDGRTGETDIRTDVVIGIVLAWMLGLGVLFLSLYSGYATEAYALLFGEILGIIRRMWLSLWSPGGYAGGYRDYVPPVIVCFGGQRCGRSKRRAGEAPIHPLYGSAGNLGFRICPGGGGITDFCPAGHAAGDCRAAYGASGHAIALSVLLALLFTWIGLFVSFYLPYPVSFSLRHWLLSPIS